MKTFNNYFKKLYQNSLRYWSFQFSFKQEFNLVKWTRSKERLYQITKAFNRKHFAKPGKFSTSFTIKLIDMQIQLFHFTCGSFFPHFLFPIFSYSEPSSKELNVWNIIITYNTVEIINNIINNKYQPKFIFVPLYSQAF